VDGVADLLAELALDALRLERREHLGQLGIFADAVAEASVEPRHQLERSRDCAMSTKIERKIASSETTIVSNPKGNGSNGARPSAPTFHRIQIANQTMWNVKNHAELAARVRASAKLWSGVRSAACAALIARMAFDVATPR
jgi:hypothetical protein